MNLLIVSDRFYPEEFLINDLFKELKKVFKVDVLTQSPSYPYDKIYKGYKNSFISKKNIEGSTIYRIFTILGYNKSVLIKMLNYISFGFFSTVLALFIGKKYDVVFYYQTGPLTQVQSAGVFNNIFKTKCILWTQDIWPETVFGYGFSKNKINLFLLESYVRSIYKNCNKILITSKDLTEKVTPFTINSVDYIPQWFYGEMPTKDISPYKDNKKRITFAGNIGKVQNLIEVINAWSLVKEKKDFILNIVGDGSFRDDLIKYAKDKEIESVEFPGRVPYNEISSWLVNSHFLLLSLKDDPVFNLTIPAKFQAYLAAEKPLFCITNGILNKLVERKSIGIKSCSSSIVEISNGFTEIINMDDKRYGILKKNVKALNNEEFNREKIITNIIDIINQLEE